MDFPSSFKFKRSGCQRGEHPESKCAEFIKKLIAEAASIKGKAFSDEAMTLFNRVSESGFRLQEMSDSGEAGYRRGKRVVYINPVRSANNSRENDHSQNAYAVTALNELMHHAKNSGRYDDFT